YPEGNGEGEPHAAQHVPVLRPMAGGPQVEIGVADAADHGLFVLQLADQALGDVEAVHHLGIAGGFGLRVHGTAHLSNTLPPVRRGLRISATGACVVTACLIERSQINSSSSSRVQV